MVDKLTILRLFLRQADALVSRSTTLDPLRWLIIILAAAIFLSFYLGCFTWIIIIFAILTVLVVIIFLIVYIYFMLKNPECLRTEKYLLRKTEIEKGYFGDNVTGQIERDTINPTGMLDYNTTKGSEDEQ